MKRADRRDNSDDNSINNPRSQQSEPVSYHELKASLNTVRAQKSELQQQVQAAEKRWEQTQQLYLEEQQKRQSTTALYQEAQSQVQSYLIRFNEEQQKYQSTIALYQEAQSQAQSYLTLYNEEQQKHQSTIVLYQEAQSQAQSYLTLYNEEKTKTSSLLIQYEQAQVEIQNYLTLYNEAQSQLKFERRSKAGIKGWETRRKRENERLKQEIGEMAALLRDSLSRKEEAIQNLEVLAERMDRIQTLVDSVEEDSQSNPLSLLQKFKRIWQAVKDILAE